MLFPSSVSAVYAGTENELCSGCSAGRHEGARGVSCRVLGHVVGCAVDRDLSQLLCLRLPALPPRPPPVLISCFKLWVRLSSCTLPSW